jgi:hypothetical protein
VQACLAYAQELMQKEDEDAARNLPPPATA